MSDVVIRARDISKQYQIGASSQTARNYERLTETVQHLLTAPFRRLAGRARPGGRTESFWALKDISFELQSGEVLGVIGRNGAGKSTLLKILSRITYPTTGEARIYGRVGSLLEVGTGFHPELTGRENIYLSGTILGMRKKEIDRKFDEIVEFAEIEKFIETPVKRYSSGMYVRLAFAVAAHLETEILMVDEVLAVGDAKFQRKCLGKMQNVAGEGRTILFVSHSMPAIQNLCSRGIVLSEGRIAFDGEVGPAVEYYMKDAEDSSAIIVDLQEARRFGSGEMRLQRFWLEDEDHTPVASVRSGKTCHLAVEYVSVDGQPRRDVSMSIHINTIMGAPISMVNTALTRQTFDHAAPHGVIRLTLPRIPLTAGRYVVDLNLATHAGNTYADFIRGAATFDIEDGDFYGTGRAGNTGAPVFFDGSWSIAHE